MVDNNCSDRPHFINYQDMVGQRVLFVSTYQLVELAKRRYLVFASILAELDNINIAAHAAYKHSIFFYSHHIFVTYATLTFVIYHIFFQLT